MKIQNIQFKKSRHTDLPTMWDGSSTWSVQMGSAGAGENEATTCCLKFYPPNVPEHRKPGVLFDVVSSCKDTVKFVLEQLARSRHALEAQKALQRLEEVGVVANRCMQI